MTVDPVLVGLAFGAGIAGFFSPCAIALLPAYVGYFLGTNEKDGLVRDLPTSIVTGIGFGLAASLGFLVIFTAIGALLAYAGSAVIGPYLTYVSLAMGAIILVLGVLMLLDRAPTLNIPVKAPQSKGFRSIFLFGALYGLTSLGCNLPVFASIVLGGLTGGGFLNGFLVYLAFAAGMGIIMLIVSLALSVSREEMTKHLRRVMPHVKTVSASLLVLAGGYILWYFGRTLWH